MMIRSLRCKCAGIAVWAPRLSHSGSGLLRIVVAVTIGTVSMQQPLGAESGKPDAEVEHRVQVLTPSLDDYVANGTKAFGIPGLAVGIIAGDKPVYSKGYGVRKRGGQGVDTKTLFQVGSTTKAFLATTMAIAVDRR